MKTEVKREETHMASESIAVTVIASKKLVEKVVEDLYGLAKDKVGFHFKKWKAASHSDTVFKHIRQLRMVKTILQSEREIDLADFYCPSRVLLGKKRSVVNQLADFQEDCSLVIEGTVGQGKSIFLRYLAAVEFCTTRRVPVFIQLQRCRQGKTIVEMALNELKALGFEMTEDLFNVFVAEGKILLLLDAFDEVKEELRNDVLLEVETLIRQNELLRVVVTSRPDSGISNSPLLRVFKLCPLAGNEYEQVIRRMAHESGTAEAIIAGINKESARVAELLTTPLMVALLMIRYKIDQSLPQNNVAFYDSLFSLLLQRHDKSKGGYTRPRKSGLGDISLEEFFNALCFVTSKVNQTSFKKVELITFSKEAFKIVKPKGDLDKILNDILEITCLLIADGDECRFIHKNVQEYHAALFIKNQPEKAAVTFYSAMENKWRNWKEELAFLKQIDTYRFFKFCYIPEARRLLQGQDGVKMPFGPEVLARVCGGDRLAFSDDKSETESLTVASTGDSLASQELLKESDYVHEIFGISKSININSKEVTFYRDGPDKFTVSVKQLLDSKAHGEDAAVICAKFCGLLHKELQKAEEYVAKIEDMEAVLKF